MVAFGGDGGGGAESYQLFMLNFVTLLLVISLHLHLCFSLRLLFYIYTCE